ncbi:thrombopoietin receptor isoform X2 [Salmo trutta]|uniref:MPL proto-oncogene, thrombopoietin receptor n=1 Tax=Salmo trutta TaxID=8032 RepID=A0A674E477_SALTR|nr:thrombopoietin receptor-like isoform X2 [Salmo trutta]
MGHTCHLSVDVMDLHLTSRVLSVWLWIIAGWVNVLGHGIVDEAVPHLSKKDVLLLAGDADPKCFTRTQYDFTCFWEAPGNTAYDFFYRNDNEEKEKRCKLTLQRTEKGEEEKVLHVCFFPCSDVFLFTLTHIRVVESSSNYTLFTRTISVEDQGLLEPPVNVSLHPTGQAGQFQVAWHASRDWKNNVHYGMRYSSQGLGERTELIRSMRSPIHSLVSLLPGEVVSVQLRVKPNGYSETETSGHWSDWSVPITAMVPQSAADISLLCHTSDLQNITCQWNGQSYRDATYTLNYKLGASKREGWRKCLQNENTSYQCRFHGAESSEILVKLGTGPGSLKRTFYTEPFRLNNSIQTGPPGRLRGQWEGGRLRLRWGAPLLALSLHLMYQLRFQHQGEAVWKLVTLQVPENSTCLDIQTGSQYFIQVRARPNGSVYAGYWSDWSPPLTVDTPSDIGALFILCIPLMMLILSVVFLSMFSRYLSKLKRYLWPPVPKLDKVLHGFLTDINGQTWDPPFIIKQYSEETPACVVEIMSEREAPDGGKLPRDSSLLLSPERGSAGGEEERLPTLALELSQDYVTLATDDVNPCFQGNKYVYDGEVGTESRSLGEDEVLQMRCHCSSNFPSSSSTTDILNRSYMLLAEQPIEILDCQDSSRAGKLYANL